MAGKMPIPTPAPHSISNSLTTRTPTQSPSSHQISSPSSPQRMPLVPSHGWKDADSDSRATFDLQLPHDAHPHTISIQPPDKLTVESAADASRALPWLERCRFRLPRDIRSPTPSRRAPPHNLHPATR